MKYKLWENSLNKTQFLYFEISIIHCCAQVVTLYQNIDHIICRRNMSAQETVLQVHAYVIWYKTSQQKFFVIIIMIRLSHYLYGHLNGYYIYINISFSSFFINEQVSETIYSIFVIRMTKRFLGHFFILGPIYILGIIYSISIQTFTINW